MLWNIALNVVLVVLMVAGIFYAWRLQAALKGLQKNREDMEKFVTDFTGSITRAEKAIRDLQETARGVGGDVDAQIVRAHGLRDELTFLVEAADKIATRLADNTSLAQKDARVQRHQMSQAAEAPEKPAMQETRPQEIKPREQTPTENKSPAPAPQATPSLPAWAKRVEKDVAVINGPVDLPEPVSGLTFGRQPVGQKAPDKIRAMTSTVTSTVASTVPPAPQAEAQSLKEQPRSQAERELLQALEKMR